MAVAALVQRPLTSLIWCGRRASSGVRDLAGQDDRNGGHPLPGRLPEDDPRPRGASSRRRKEVNVGSACCRRSPAGSADAMLGGYTNVEGVDLRLRGKEPARRSGRQAWGARPTTSWSWSPAARARRRSAADPPLHRRAGARHRAAVADPRRRHRRGPRCERRPRPQGDRSRGQGDPPPARSEAAAGPGPTATWTRRPGRGSPPGWPPTNRSPRRRRPRGAQRRYLPGAIPE